jgi:hypothetical protein
MGSSIDDKYLGEFTASRQLSNMLSNPNIDGADEWVYTIDLTSASLLDEVTINGVSFSKALVKDVSLRRFTNAAALAECINNSTYGVSGARADGAGYLVSVRSDPPGSSLSVSVSGGISVSDERIVAGLLEQYVVYHTDQLIVLSDSAVDWFSPSRNNGRHVGWYFDLQGNSERVINDILIRDGKAIVLATVPSSDPCTSGGHTIEFLVNACTGGRVAAAVFDINGDGRIDTHDLINIGSFANPIWVAPTGMKRGGIWYTPAILSKGRNGEDILYFSTSEGEIETELVAGEQLGMYYWRLWRQD